MKGPKWECRLTLHHLDRGATEFGEISIYSYPNSDKREAHVSRYRGDMDNVPEDFKDRLHPHKRWVFTASDYALLKDMMANYYGPNAYFEG